MNNFDPKPTIIKRVINVDVVNAQHKVFSDLNGRQRGRIKEKVKRQANCTL